MRIGLSQDTAVTMKGLVDAITFNTYNGEDMLGTATTISVAVRTSPFPDDDTTAGVYIKPVTGTMPVRAVGDFQRRVEEFFWLYCQAPKKATLSDVVNSLVVGLNAVRKKSARTGNAAELEFIEVLGEQDAADPSATPQRHVKIVQVRVYWWYGIGA